MRAESATPTSPCSQIFPSDISKNGDTETVLEVAEVTYDYLLPAIFDPTTLDVGFDLKCFDGLDDMLIYSPTSAFEEVCWSDVVSDAEARQNVAPRPRKQSDTRRKRPARSFLDTSSSSDSDTDSDECRTLNEKDHRYYSQHPILRPNGVSTGLDAAVGEFSSYVSLKLLFLLASCLALRILNFMPAFTKSMLTHIPWLQDDDCYDYEENGPFMLSSFDSSPFPVSITKDTVGGFPVPSAPHRKTVPNRIAALAHRLTFVRAPPS